MKKKVLFVTAFPPSENAAAEKNTMLMLKDLGEKYNVDLVYFKDADKKEYTPPLPSVKVLRVVPNSTKFRIKNAIRHPFTHPIFTVRLSNQLLKLLQTSIESNAYSAIIFDHSQTQNYARKLRFDGPKLLICHDVEAQRFERTSNRIMAWECRKSERAVLSAPQAHVFTFCQKDADLIKEYYQINADVILDYIDERIVNNKIEVITDDFVMFGNWTRKDNYEGAVWLLNQLDELLEKKIVVNVIGKGFPVEKLNKPFANIQLNTVGFVDNPYPLIAKSKAMLCPLLTGAGIKVKVIESLASGTPVIGTDIAFEGFSDKYEAVMLKSNTPQEFADAIKRISYTKEERLEFKEMFIKDYAAATIPQWIEKIVNK